MDFLSRFLNGMKHSSLKLYLSRSNTVSNEVQEKNQFQGYDWLWYNFYKGIKS